MMNDTQKLNYLLNQLKETADRQHVYDGHEEYNSATNGNYDDTFADGAEYGEVQGARDVLRQLKLYVNTYNRLMQTDPSMARNEMSWFDNLEAGK